MVMLHKVAVVAPAEQGAGQAVADGSKPEAAETLLRPDEAGVRMIDELLQGVPAIRYELEPRGSSPSSPESEPRERYRIRNQEGDQIGEFALERQAYGYDNAACFRRVRLFDGFRRSGYGPSLYLTVMRDLAKEGVALVSDRRMTMAGVGAWDRLVRAGLAVQSNGIVPFGSGNQVESSNGLEIFRTTLFPGREFKQPRQKPSSRSGLFRRVAGSVLTAVRRSGN